MNFRLVVVAIFCVVILASSSACVEENIEFTFENRTNADLCVEVVYPDVRGDYGCRIIEARKTHEWFFECGDGPGTDEVLVTVVITSEEALEMIYDQTVECRVWQESNRVFIIEGDVGEFVVTDPLQ